MNWIDVAKLIAPLAPTLGGILGGFIPIPGGAAAGQLVGMAIARAFGVPNTPDAIAGAIKSNPDDLVRAKLNEALEELKSNNETIRAIEAARLHKEEVEAAQVNTTIRAELVAPQHWFFTGWRPMSGWILNVENGSLGVLAIGALVMAMCGNGEPLKALTAAWPVLLTVIGVPAMVVGVNVFGRSQEKVAATNAVATAALPTIAAKPPPTKR